MGLSATQISGLSFGYLTGADLLSFCPFQLLNRQYSLDPTSLQRGVNTGISELIAALNTRYDLSAELLKIGFTQAQGTAVLTSSAVTSVQMTSGGTTYLSAPSVSFSGGGGSGAAGTAVITNGQVTGVIVTAGGTGYTSAPTVTFSGGGPTVGAGAVLQAQFVNNQLTGVTVVNGGAGYMTPPEIVFTGGFTYTPPPNTTGPQCTADAFAVVSGGVITSVTMTNLGKGYTSAPNVQAYATTPVPDNRSTFLVKMLTLVSLRNILGNAQDVSDFMQALFDDNRRDIFAIRNGQINAPLPPAMKDVRSSANMVHSRFKTLG